MKIIIMGSDAERRAGLKTLLRRVARQAQFTEAKDWRQAASALRRIEARMIVIDWADTMRMSELEALLANAPAVPAAVMVDRSGAAQVYMLMSAGAMGVIPRTLDPILILRALEMVLIGGQYVPPDVIDLAPIRSLPIRRQQTMAAQPSSAPVHPTLSPRQQQIMRCVHMGSTNKMIAKTLGISEGTVKIHLASIFQQLGATNRAAAVAIYNGVQNSYLEILRSDAQQSVRATPGESNVVPLRKRRVKYPSLKDQEGASLPMAAEPEASF
ncbi:response regulator transcription factor [Caballeronia sp. LZ062]|uniref:helix-turn-helix transcriptional regulator n=1 Tax=unclassified Caballeronia TaxID=2646786 RepID=UPI0028590D02|nr:MULTISPECIES: response regulator transcription factor [unclassified Caballeronia]MDR5854775.1 response regulator transcription factor [Caballeronia sp. LZ050]MDR5870696.1 response regulator transcription factor [Caballeronia sp. LZ062]